MAGNPEAARKDYKMKYEEINKKFTEAVMEWLSKGYYLNSATMRGSQGEKGKVDLTNGKEIVRVMLANFNYHDKAEGYTHYEGIELVVGRDTSGQKPNTDDGFDTIWNQDLEVLSSQKFYAIGSNRGYSQWYGTKEEAREADRMRFERFKAKDARRSLNNKTFGITAGIIVLPKIRAIRGCKGAKAGDVKVEKRVCDGAARYTATYNGKTVKLA